MKSAPTIEPAQSAVAATIQALLRQADLPHENFTAHLPHFLVARKGDAVVGSVGLEIYRPDALLRSLVVTPTHRANGLGCALVREICALAERRGVTRLFLLTTTATPFFERLGFARFHRGEAPPAIAASSQFQGLCPVSAVCLAARIEDVSP